MPFFHKLDIELPGNGKTPYRIGENRTFPYSKNIHGPIFEVASHGKIHYRGRGPLGTFTLSYLSPMPAEIHRMKAERERENAMDMYARSGISKMSATFMICHAASTH